MYKFSLPILPQRKKIIFALEMVIKRKGIAGNLINKIFNRILLLATGEWGIIVDVVPHRSHIRRQYSQCYFARFGKTKTLVKVTDSIWI